MRREIPNEPKREIRLDAREAFIQATINNKVFAYDTRIITRNFGFVIKILDADQVRFNPERYQRISSEEDLHCLLQERALSVWLTPAQKLIIKGNQG